MPTILGELRRYFRDATWDVRPARDLQELCLAVEAARESCGPTSAARPTVADIAAPLGRAPEEVIEALQATEGRSVRSLDAPVHDEEEGSASAGDLIGAHRRGFERVEAGVTIERLPDPGRARAGDPAPALAEDLLQSRDRRARRLLADARLADHPLFAREPVRAYGSGQILP